MHGTMAIVLRSHKCSPEQRQKMEALPAACRPPAPRLSALEPERQPSENLLAATLERGNCIRNTHDHTAAAREASLTIFTRLLTSATFQDINSRFHLCQKRGSGSAT